MHHNVLGYSGTDGNAVWIHNNEFYDNTMGFSTDVFTAPGHPGFPQDSDLIEDNDFYSNNFNAYLPLCQAGQKPGPTAQPGLLGRHPAVPVPVGTGMWIAGGNHNVVRNNRFWDNWRRGAMLFAGPGLPVVCKRPRHDQVAGCDPTATVPPSTSYRNQFYGNQMGVAPDGCRAAERRGLLVGPGRDSVDHHARTRRNCWYNNTGSDGTCRERDRSAVAERRCAEQPAVQLCAPAHRLAPGWAGHRASNCARSPSEPRAVRGSRPRPSHSPSHSRSSIPPRCGNPRCRRRGSSGRRLRWRAEHAARSWTSAPTLASRSLSPTATTGTRPTPSSASGRSSRSRTSRAARWSATTRTLRHGTGSVLDDKQAYDLFNSYCEESFARGFKLYHLYQRAAGFAGQPPQ